MYSDVNDLKNEELFNTNYKVKLVGFLSHSMRPRYFFKSHEEIYVLEIDTMKDAYRMFDKINSEDFHNLFNDVSVVVNLEFQLLNMEVYVNKDADVIFDSNFLQLFIEDELPFEIMNIKDKFSKSGTFTRFQEFGDYLFDNRTLSEIIDGYKTKETPSKKTYKEKEKEESRF